MATLTPEAKSQLSRTVRALRERLLTDLRAAADGIYRLSVPVSKAGLAERERILRQRLEDWLDEQARADRGKKESTGDARERHRLAAEKLAGATLLNRLVVIKHMEGLEMIRPAVVTDGWGSPGYREFRDFAPALASGETEGYATPYGCCSTSLFPVPAATLRALVEALDDPGLDSAWTDDSTLGRVLLPQPGRREVPQRPLPRRRPRLLLEIPPGQGLPVAAAPPGRGRPRLHPRRGRLGRPARRLRARTPGPSRRADRRRDQRRERGRKKKAREEAKKADAAPPTVAGQLFS